MKTKPILLLAFILAVCAFGRPAIADLTSSDIYELNTATPGTQKIQSGTGLGTLLAGSALSGVYVGTIDTNSPSTTASSATMVQWNIPTSNYSLPLGNGLPGQTITIVKNNTGTTAGKISPTTKTGFTDITLTNQGDGVELRYVNSTSGWVPAGVFGGASTVGKVNP